MSVQCCLYVVYVVCFEFSHLLYVIFSVGVGVIESKFCALSLLPITFDLIMSPV